MSDRTYRVIQWATGSIGQIAIRHIAENAPLYADVDTMARILRSGRNIVTPVGFIYPKALEPKVVQKLEDACQAGSTTLHGAGIHPGFSGDLLPMTYARLSSRIDQITVQEVADLAPHPSHAMNFDVAVAKRDLTVRSGEIPKGTVAGMRHEWTTWSAGQPVIVFRSFWKMDDDLDPNWGFGTIKYSLRIEGDPALNVAFEAGRKHPTGDEGYWVREPVTLIQR